MEDEPAQPHGTGAPMVADDQAAAGPKWEGRALGARTTSRRRLDSTRLEPALDVIQL